MLRFAANLSLLFTEHPLPARFAAAAAAGFKEVEIQFPYSHPARLLRDAADSAGTDIILINVPAGDLMQGGFGLAGHPERRDQFAEALDNAVEYAVTLGVRMVNVLPGRQDPAFSREESLRALASNLALAGEILAPHDIRVTCEAINRHDMPDFLISTSAELAAILRDSLHHNLGMQIDLYHMARMQEDIPNLISRYLPKIAHIQFADHPGRHEPGSGELPLKQLFHFLKVMDYNGSCAAEYLPSKKTEETLEWLSWQ